MGDLVDDAYDAVHEDAVEGRGTMQTIDHFQTNLGLPKNGNCARVARQPA
jgi:hypothetical protein